MSRPPSVSVSPKRSSFSTRRSASLHIQRCRGVSIRSNGVARSWGRVGTIQLGDIDVETQHQECHQNVKVYAIQSIPISALVQFGVSFGEGLPAGESRRLEYVSARAIAEIGLAC